MGDLYSLQPPGVLVPWCEGSCPDDSIVRFAPFNVSYPGIATQFRKSRFDASANLWWAVYDADQRAADERGKSGMGWRKYRRVL